MKAKALKEVLDQEHQMLKLTLDVLAKENEKLKQQATELDNNVKNEYLKICITDYMCSNYFINVNAYSGIRYLLNCIIITSDWYYYYNKTLVKLYVKLGETAANPKETKNCFYDRLQLIKQINDQ